MTANRNFFLNLIYKSIKNGSSRVAVIAVSILLGACVCAAFINVYLDIDSKVSRELKTYGANMIFAPTNMAIVDDMSEDKYNQIVAKIPADKLLGDSGYIFTQANIGPTNAIIMGVKFSKLKTVKPFLDVRDGTMINVDFDDKNVLIGVDLAKQAGFKVGDTIDLRAIGSNDGEKVKIKGIVASGDKEDALLITSLNLAQKIAKKENKINYAEAVVLGNFDEINAFAKNLDSDEIVAKPVAKVSKSEGFILEKIKLLMALVSLVILLITSMCVNTTLSSILLSRSREIALLRALGASKNDVSKLFGFETFMIAFLSALLGAFLGYFLAQVLGYAIFDSSIDFRILSVPLAVIISLVFAAVAALYPIKRALDNKMADILRGE
ncbi:ABC transporter permease [Campylobacter sp. faydin G-24]|uniref:ABC transporter permease n=1 Tax=Campylobacter anatolicus TaxID=2829105 RepID=A0ABS5HGE9_9BACT|nr:FtsX-like permease family protein [Campylobacter anatolicus]MBR8461607.1 ABC transporter permease [Campylobacter anatolicus]MBR8463345.1 ABC transporter permease [Campylobacter anatolicus]MBR8465304.1 ABC transporter permease [Campylobacter anatolicus]